MSEKGRSRFLPLNYYIPESCFSKNLVFNLPRIQDCRLFYNYFVAILRVSRSFLIAVAGLRNRGMPGRNFRSIDKNGIKFKLKQLLSGKSVYKRKFHIIIRNRLNTVFALNLYGIICKRWCDYRDGRFLGNLKPAVSGKSCRTQEFSQFMLNPC